MQLKLTSPQRPVVYRLRSTWGARQLYTVECFVDGWDRGRSTGGIQTPGDRAETSDGYKSQGIQRPSDLYLRASERNVRRAQLLPGLPQDWSRRLPEAASEEDTGYLTKNSAENSLVSDECPEAQAHVRRRPRHTALAWSEAIRALQKRQRSPVLARNDKLEYLLLASRPVRYQQHATNLGSDHEDVLGGEEAATKKVRTSFHPISPAAPSWRRSENKEPKESHRKSER